MLLLSILAPLIIGLLLGLLGGGGTVLAVPVLIYLFGIDTKLAIAMSLFIVGISSLIASTMHIFKKRINIPCTLVFGLFGMSSSFLSARYLAPLLSESFQLILFSILIITIAILMLQPYRENIVIIKPKLDFKRCLLIVISGSTVGLITGLIGVGGGFLIVPCLVHIMGLSMLEAIGSSLIIGTMQSLSAFVGYLDLVEIPWNFVFRFTTLVILGTAIGTFLTVKIDPKYLKKIFAILLLGIGAFILYNRLILAN